MKKSFLRIIFFCILFSFSLCQYTSSMKTAKIYEMNKNFDAAISIYKDIIRKSPNNFQAIRSLKYIYKKSQRYDDGINSAIQVCYLIDNQNKKISELINEIPKTYQTPTMAPFCKDEEKYKVVQSLVKKIEDLKANNTKIDNQTITNIMTVNGVRFSFEDGSWGLIRASSNKPSLVVVTESPASDKRKKEIFEFIDKLLRETGKVGEYDQKI